MLGLNWTKETNHTLANGTVILPTILQNVNGQVLGLVYSSESSLKETLQTGKCIFYSRSRKGLWLKSPSGVNQPLLLEMRPDCDKDALWFQVDQRPGTCFCHVKGQVSCFHPESSLVVCQPPVFRIGYCLGRSAAVTLSFLKEAGLIVYKEHESRNDQLLIKTSLHHGRIVLIGCKPKDIHNLLSSRMIDMAICYTDCIPQHEDLRRWIRPKGIRPIQIVSVIRKDSQMPTRPVVLSEYPHVEHGYENAEKTLIVHGHAENLIRQGMGDVGIVIKDTGQSIVQNHLQVHRVLQESDIGVHVYRETYLRFPRLCKTFRNAIEQDAIHFYSVDDAYGAFSNLYPSPFVDKNNLKWASVEHFYQAQKFADYPLLFEAIRNQPTAKQAYKYAYAGENKWIFTDKETGLLKAYWKEKRDPVMWEALQYKFQQHLKFAQLLLSTGDCVLKEHALKDSHFGIGVDEKGENVLGKMLMELRCTLRKTRPAIASAL